MHLISLDALMNAYPDARIVFTHRDPFTAMLSGASLVFNWSTLASQNPDRQKIAQWFPRIWGKALLKSLKDRDHWPRNQFFDLYFDKLMSDPAGAVRSIYEHFELTVLPGHLKRISVWLRDNPKASFGTHSYAADDFALTREKENTRFSVYKRRFVV